MQLPVFPLELDRRVEITPIEGITRFDKPVDQVDELLVEACQRSMLMFGQEPLSPLADHDV